MTTNSIITNTELEAIRSVERYIATSIPRGEPFSPSQTVQEDIETVSYMLARLAPAPPAEEVATRPNGEPKAGSPIGIVRDHPSHGPDRSIPGQGQQCFIYVLGRADQHADSIVSSYGQISAGCGPNLREDFAETTWPVVVKVKPRVTERDLIQHLRDLADAIVEHTKPEALQRTLGARWSRQPDQTEPTEEERRLGIVASGDLDRKIPF